MHRFSRRRAAHLRLGRRGESLACRMLRAAGTEVLARNYQGRHGEIDIVARDAETLCFVEVKTRRRSIKSTPGEAVGTAKRQRICAAAREYLRSIGMPPVTYRFDIVEVVLPRRGPIRLDYHQSAFVSERSLF
ncbi:MAG: YraN family protein [Verrucomicrobiota bacterium]